MRFAFECVVFDVFDACLDFALVGRRIETRRQDRRPIVGGEVAKLRVQFHGRLHSRSGVRFSRFAKRYTLSRLRNGSPLGDARPTHALCDAETSPVHVGED